MTLSRKQLGRLISACALGLASLSGAAVSHAESAHRVDGESSVRCEGQLVAAIIVGNRGRLEIPVFPTMATVVVFQHRIKQVRQGKKSEVSASIFQDKVLMVMPSPAARPGMVVEVNVHANPTRQTLYFRVVGDPEDATVAAAIMEREPDTDGRAYTACVPIDSSLELARMVADQDARITELTARIDEQKAQSVKQAEERARAEALLAVETSAGADTDILAKLLADREVMPINDRDPRQHGMLVHGVAWQKVDGTYYLVYEIENRDPRAFRVAGLQVFDDLMIKNHAGEAVIGDRRRQGALLATIEPGELVRGIVTIHEPMSLGKSVSVILSEPEGGQPPVVRRTLPLWDLTPPPHENEGKMSVDLQAVYGAIWLANPLDDKQLDPTSLAGLGARVTYGMSKRISVEAELMGARTGEAGFQVMDGELMRSAVLGRAQGGILARFGQGRYRPFMRLGLGLQGASHTAEILMEDGSRMPGPDVAFEFSATVHFGGGLDLRIGDHLILGIGLSTVLLAKTTASESAAPIALETGFHLGYTWSP